MREVICLRINGHQFRHGIFVGGETDSQRFSFSLCKGCICTFRNGIFKGCHRIFKNLEIWGYLVIKLFLTVKVISKVDELQITGILTLTSTIDSKMHFLSFSIFLKPSFLWHRCKTRKYTLSSIIQLLPWKTMSPLLCDSSLSGF